MSTPKAAQPQRRLTTAHWLAELCDAVGRRSIDVFCHGTLQVKLYAPRGEDPQQPHAQDEIYVVISGNGFFRIGQTRQPFEPGEVLFAPAGSRHRFEEFSDDFSTWVFFYGPEGGESAASNLQ